MILVSVGHLARITRSFVEKNEQVQAIMFPYIKSLCRIIDITLIQCSPLTDFEELHRRNQYKFDAVRVACKECISYIVQGNISFSQALISSEFQRVFEIFSHDLNSNLSDRVALNFFIRICKPSAYLPPLSQVQQHVMQVFLDDNNTNLRNAMRHCFTWYSEDATEYDVEPIISILECITAGNNMTTTSKLTDLLHGSSASEGLKPSDPKEKSKQIDGASALQYFSSALEEFSSLLEPNGSGGSNARDLRDGNKDNIPQNLAKLSLLLINIITTLPVDPDVITSKLLWMFCEQFCLFFEAYTPGESGRKLNLVKVVESGLLVFECYLKAAASNSMLEAIFDEYGESLRKMILLCQRMKESKETSNNNILELSRRILWAAGEKVESPKKKLKHLIQKKIIPEFSNRLSARSEVENRTYFKELELFQSVISQNPLILNKIKLRRFDLSNEMERGLGLTVRLQLDNESHRFMTVLLFDWLEKPIPSALILILVCVGATLSIMDLAGALKIGDNLHQTIEYVISSIFFIEVVIRMTGFVYKFGDGNISVLYRKVVNRKTETVVYPFVSDPMNVIDIFCVLSDILLRIIMYATASNGKFGSNLIAFLKLFRLARLLKAGRYVLQVANVHLVSFVEKKKIVVKNSREERWPRVGWDDLVSRMVKYGMANYNQIGKKETIIRIFDTLYFSLLKHRTVNNEDLSVSELDQYPAAVHGFKTQREEYECYQSTMVENGVSKLLFLAICNAPPSWTTTSSTVYSAFRLMTETLQGGNTAIQSRLIKCINEDDPDGKFHQHLASKMLLTQELVQTWRYGDDGGKDILEQYQMKLEQAADTFEVLQLFVEGHNEEFQLLLSRQPSHVTSIDLLHHAVLTLLVICEDTDIIESMLDEEICLAQQIFSFLAESCYGPCIENQIAIATKLDAVVAVRNVLKLTLPMERNDWSESETNRFMLMIKLKLAAMQLIFACFEGHTNEDDVVTILKGKLEPTLLSQLEITLERMARRRIAHLEEGGSSDKHAIQNARKVYFDMVDGICKIRALFDLLNRSKSNEESASQLRSRTTSMSNSTTTFTHVKDYAFGESLYGVVEIYWRNCTTATYFPLPIERNLSQEVRDSVLSKIDVAVGRRVRDLVARREMIMETVRIIGIAIHCENTLLTLTFCFFTCES